MLNGKARPFGDLRKKNSVKITTKKNKTKKLLIHVIRNLPISYEMNGISWLNIFSE